MSWNHWVAKAWPPHEPFLDFESASWFWKRLGRVFPELVTAVLMPDHCHLILPKDVDARKKLSGLLAAMSVRTETRNLWQPSPDAKEIPNILHLRRHIRYVALNPCRNQLCKDPIEWYWSTYREIIGATVDFNQTPNRWAQLLKDSPKNFAVRFHAYVSGDPSVSVSGTPFPKPATPPQSIPERSIGEILRASAAALRTHPNQIKKDPTFRKLFVHQAYHHGWKYPTYIAKVCGTTRYAIYKILDKDQPQGLSAANLCLGDERLSSRKFLQNVEL